MKLDGLDDNLMGKLSEDRYFTQARDEKEKGQDAFYKQGDKSDVRRSLVLNTGKVQ